MIQKVALPRFTSRHFIAIAFGVLCAAVLFTASASALSEQQLAKQYGLSKKDASQLLSDVRDDVQQQCKGRTGGEMSQCVTSKTGSVLQQHASKCVKNKKLDESCSQQVTKQNNSPTPSGGGGAGGGAAAGGGIGGGTGCDGSTCGHQCGASDQNPYTPAIDIGCKGKGNPIMDALFGIIRFLSDGVGLVVIGSIIVGGIQFSGSRGDPQSTAMAINRIRSSLFALLIYIFAYAMLNYLIPGAVLQ